MRAVARAVGVYHPRGDYLVPLHIIHLELLSVSEVLKYISVFVSYCYLHMIPP